MSEPTVTDLAEDPRIKSVVELQASIEDEIAAIKDGTLAESKGRVISTFRRHQYRGIELTIQAARLDITVKRDLGKRFRTVPALNAPQATIEELKPIEELRSDPEPATKTGSTK